jgi:hypothetical protein
MASVEIGTSLNNLNTGDILIPNHFTLSESAILRGTLNLQNATSVTLPPSERTLVNGSALSATISSNGVPVGSIAIWYTSTSIPTGWFECDGRTINGVTIPNLQGRFVMCASTTYPANNPGGSTTIAVSQFPRHNHGTITTNVGGKHNHRIGGRNGNSDGDTRGVWHNGTSGDTSKNIGTETEGAHSHTGNPPTDTTGSSDTSFNILPPYYSLIYITKLS